MNSEELKYYLPDYIKGNIDNPELAENIRKEIDTNPDFRMEYNNLAKVSDFLISTKFEEPPEFYFNNLLPNIRQSISSSSENKVDIFHRFLFPKLKYIIPVLSVLLLFIVYKISFRPDKIAEIIPEHNKQEIYTPDKVENKDNIVEKDDTVNTIEETFTKKEPTQKTVTQNKNQTELSTNETEQLTEKAFFVENNEELFYSNDDESNYESEFEKLNSEEQNKILNEIKNSKF